MRYIGILIDEVGDQSANPRADVTDTAGVSDNEILTYFRNAQRRLQNRIVSNVPNTGLFDKRTDYAVSAGDSSLAIPGDLFFNLKIKRIQISTDGGASWYNLTPGASSRVVIDTQIGNPSFYTVSGSEILFEGTIQSDCLARITYVRRLDRLDIRRGTISSSTKDATNFLTLVLEDDTYLSASAITKYIGDYFCVNDRRGNVLYYNAELDDYDEGTRTISITNSLLSVGTMPDGAYITLGSYSTTHSQLFDEAEQYLTEFVDWKIKKSDSSVDSEESSKELVAIEDSMIAQASNFTDIQGLLIVDDLHS